MGEAGGSFIGVADTLNSYESLPPNFSLLQNMAAGAFAGIAEHCASKQSFKAPFPSAHAGDP